MQRSLVLTDRSNEQLLTGAKHLVGEERKTTAYLIAHLAEIDARALHLAEGFSCLSKYCMEALGLSEDASYRRADAAFIAQRYPIVLEMLAEGSIHLTTLRIIGGCLTNENHKGVLNAARNKSKAQLELLKASLCPQPDVPAMLRKLPGSEPVSEQTEPVNGLFVSESDDAPGGMAAGTTVTAEGSVEVPVQTPAPVRKLTPLSPQRYKLQLTVDEETYDALRQLQDLLRHQVRNGDLAVIVKDAVLQRLERVQRERFGQVKRPRKADGQTGFITEPEAQVKQADPDVDSGQADARISSSQNPRVNSRHIPSNVKRSVWKRDQGRCAFVSSNGRHCSERGRLEYHHVKAYALGGPATIENIALRCRAHNAHEGVQLFGWNGKKLTGASASAKVTRASASASGVSAPKVTGAGAS
jgi:hypothetical protein